MDLGLRVQVTDLGSGGGVVLDHFIPPGRAPTVCGDDDGWRVRPGCTSRQAYSNRTNSIPPLCVAGSANHVGKASVNNRTDSLRGMKHFVQAEDATFPGLTGPFRVVVVYGSTTEELAGRCSEVNFTADECSGAGDSSLSCKR